MIRRPPRSTRTDTLFPYTTLSRSREILRRSRTLSDPGGRPDGGCPAGDDLDLPDAPRNPAGPSRRLSHLRHGARAGNGHRRRWDECRTARHVASLLDRAGADHPRLSSEARRVGQESVSTFESRVLPYLLKQYKT